jgi:eukaryotic-like serine/threonine-protein kinase
VKLTVDGKVKVLDFGLAKAMSGANASPAGRSHQGMANPAMPANPAISSSILTAHTRAGAVLGTAAYMSPEQASGMTVDKRTDVWSFGVLLYEMLTGKKAFDGKTVSHIIVEVLEREPDWSALPPLPSGVQDLLERCVQKDPANRLRDIGDVRVLLQAAMTKPVRVVE